MKLSELELQKLSKLAGFTVTEASRLTAQIQDIFDFLSVLDEVEAVDHDSYSHSNKDYKLRKDIPEKFQDQNLLQFPEVINGYFVIPRIIESE